MGSQKQGQNTEFTLPSPPDFMPAWALREGGDWAGLDDFSLLVQAEERTGKLLKLEYRHDLPYGTWGVHTVRGRRGIIFINKRLPPYWRRFALFHELYHFLEHNGGMELWARTATPLSSFERQADLFAWGAMRKEWTGCWEDASP